MKNKRHILLFCFVIGIFWFSLYGYVPILSVYAESLGASGKMIGLILGSYGLVQMFLRIPLGILSDRLNNRKIFVIAGMVLSITGAVGMGLFQNELFLLIFRSLTGAAAATWVSYAVLYSSYFDKTDVSRAIGTANAINSTGQMTGILLGGMIASAMGYQASFMLAAAAGFIGLLLSFKVFGNKVVEHKPESLRNLVILVKNKGLMIVSGMAVLSQIVTFSTVYGFTPNIAKSLGADSLQLGFLTAVSTIPAIISSYYSGTFFLKRFGGKISLTASFALTAISAAVIPFVPNLAMMYVTQIAGGIGRGIIMSLLMSASINSMEESKRATAMGFFQAIYGLGMFIGPMIVGFFDDIPGGLKYGFLAASAFSVIGMAMSMIFITGKSKSLGVR